MTRYHSRSGNRPAFTLVELMVVVLIIAILVSLISSAVMMAMGKIPETQTSTEISQMGTALQAMMADFNLDVPPPSTLVLSETAPLTTASGTFLAQMFGRNLGAGQPFVDWNGDGQPNGPWTLGGEECLVFYLGGINLQGFSYNKMNPTPIAGQKMHGPYFNFVTSRLYPVATGFYVYLDPWQSKSGALYGTLGGSPYAYFSSNGINNAYANTSGYGAAPYFITGTTQYMNPNTYQIISAGKDGYFGTVGWTPTSGATGHGADDQANFSSKVLGAGQQ
ncbi:MAG TPA: type II secretion system protein [Gemmataceae bacterium]|nr:type II secretion system protein [Gemmataceae bacterium]